MTEGASRLWAAYKITPNAPIHLWEFGDGYFFGKERWKREGMPEDIPYETLFGWNDRGKLTLGGLTGDNILVPGFVGETINETSDYIVTRDQMGRTIKHLRQSTLQYMPEFLEHPVTGREAWEHDVKPRLNPLSPERYAHVTQRVQEASKARDENGYIISHEIDGGFMYLRDLFGVERLMCTLIDEPELIFEAMESWLTVHDALIATYQNRIEIDELFLKEDICYKTSSLISPHMIEQFLFPYYRKLITSIRERQSRPLYLAMDTDGHIDSIIPLYKSIGFRYFSPFEVAAGCDVVELSKKYPDIVLSGGIDKRILASTIDDIEHELVRIIPVMKQRGGYIPTCDHGVPEDVPYENYVYFRKRLLELGDE